MQKVAIIWRYVIKTKGLIPASIANFDSTFIPAYPTWIITIAKLGVHSFSSIPILFLSLFL